MIPSWEPEASRCPSGVKARANGPPPLGKQASSPPDSTSHTRTDPPLDPAAARRPSGEKTTTQTPTESELPPRHARSVRRVASHRRTVPSKEPVAMHRPSGETARDMTDDA